MRLCSLVSVHFAVIPSAFLLSSRLDYHRKVAKPVVEWNMEVSPRVARSESDGESQTTIGGEEVSALRSCCQALLRICDNVTEHNPTPSTPPALAEDGTRLSGKLEHALYIYGTVYTKLNHTARKYFLLLKSYSCEY